MARSRVSEFAMPLSLVLAGAVLACLMSVVLLAVLGVDLGINLTVAGLLLCLVLLVFCMIIFVITLRLLHHYRKLK